MISKVTPFDLAGMFIVYSILGWIWETTFVSIKSKKYVNRGFLRAPIIPIYGIGVSAMIFFMSVLSETLPKNDLGALLLSIIYMALIASTLEYITSFLMEWAFKARWWDYSKRRFNLHGRIALVPSLFWGLAGFLIWTFVDIPVRSNIRSLAPSTMTLIYIVFYTGIAVDAYFTFSELINLRTVLVRMHALVDEALEQIDEGIDYIGDNIEEFFEQLEAHAAIERLLERGKKYARFYRNYPNATTRKLPLIFKSLRERLNR